MHTLDFELPARLEAGEPPEARGLRRDQVKLLVSHRHHDAITHRRFEELPECLAPGDVLVLNTSGTLNGALPAERESGERLELHLSTRLPADLWIVEPRVPDGTTSKPHASITPGERLRLPAGGVVTLHTPYDPAARPHERQPSTARLWIASLELPQAIAPYLARHAFPIRYGYVKQPWPLAYYQTVYATEPSSAEMPSAGRAFTPELLTRLVAEGVAIAPLLLHTGVSSPEEHEPPYEEFYRVPGTSADTINRARERGHRVIAVGTTAVRAVETVTDERGMVHPGEGWTRLIITP
ncbi:MAG TPA: S-adenosylmethionine:tRNA ribosyltransferase-isomerase, partial [Oscillatoriaceae cyanobacterium]